MSFPPESMRTGTLILSLKAFSDRIKVPVLILSGGKDTVISDEMHNALTSAFPVAEQIVFPDAGHASYAECPEKYHAEIIKFANKTE